MDLAVEHHAGETPDAEHGRQFILIILRWNLVIEMNINSRGVVNLVSEIDRYIYIYIYIIEIKNMQRPHMNM